MTCYVKLHPWDAFIKARYWLIVFFLKEGKSHEEIAMTLSMEVEQVEVIITSRRSLYDGDFFYAIQVDKELDE